MHRPPSSPRESHPSAPPELDWSTGFARLGERFFVPLEPSPLPAPHWIARTESLAHTLGLPEDWGTSDLWLQALSGNTQFPGSQTLATVYSGHQFGVWAGQLGDGRALLLGELRGQELQLKGAGPTPFSRMGDGRAVLRSSIREFLCSEAMHGLGIPSTRALALTGSPAPVRREEIETAAVVTRVAPSFVRFGHFEHFCHHDQHDDLRTLADYVIDRYYPACRGQSQWPSPYVALLAQVTERTAEMVSHWQAVGFCHGVMNTDNMSILGLTIDYGPFQFMDGFVPGHICNHSDTQGRYAFNKQPHVAYWNLFCLGQALLPLIEDQDSALAALESYKTLYPRAYEARMLRKIGFTQALPQALQEEAMRLLEAVPGLLAAQAVDYTIFWRRLSHWAHTCDAQDPQVVDLFLDPAAINAWLQHYRALVEQCHAHASGSHSAATMLAHNPKYVLRNHVCELAIRAAKGGDFSQIHALQQVLENPFAEHPQHEHLAGFAPDWASTLEISCSS